MSRYAVVGLVALAAIAGCSSDKTSAPSSASAHGDITVFAAASLKQTFTDLGHQFESAHPGTNVAFSFAGSSDLVTQLTQGAPADVFASADVPNMTKAVDAKLVDGAPVNFAKNTLTIVTEPGNPKHIRSFADLAQQGLLVVVCAPQVPCGSATKKVEDSTHTQLHPVSEESSVTDVLGKVTSGQADAGLVYVTDAASAGNKVTTVNFPQSAGAVNTYPIAELNQSHNKATAAAFIALVTSPQGQATLGKAGFQAPS
ncbi:molybdate ABC transporter substrate-binding protein [Skermania sp. ID1734]|uniref:molybdate ABC transporter substrate-binding protein n=1 Tax=Skermania sp. ID1734 TaxID=2597516 RepID=UPI001180C3D4|nr:molybdate ABC transporter substrate-binding protein [Skermania sp. ID1734]TSE00624.1 molybdate ABC transporter substrate-binding protein [Skermania sp. ID1734]